MRRLRLASRCLAFTALAALTLAAQAPPTPLQQAFQAETARIQELWKRKEFEAALKILAARVQSPTFGQLGAEARAGVHYNMACAAALLGRRGEALASLGLAVGEGLKDWTTFSTDSDLDPLRKEPGFLWLEGIVRQRGDFVGILRRFQAYGPASASSTAPAPAMKHAGLLLLPALLGAQEAPGLSRPEALAVLAQPGTAEARVRALVDHLHRRLPWVATDYRTRTVDEILTRGRGNCADHAKVLLDLLKAGGFEARWVQEINLQAPSERRQASARAKVAEGGKGFSVFGYQHNDHRWLEVRDSASGAWFPADSSLGVVGGEAWAAARLGFGTRPAAVADMIAPVFVEAVQPGRPPEPRSEAYLLQAFGAMAGGRIRTLPAWPAWEKAVRALEPHASSAFRGMEDLHAQAGTLTALAGAYTALRVQAQALLAPSAAELAQQGYRALLAKDPARAAGLYDQALAAGLKGAQHPCQGACAHAFWPGMGTPPSPCSRRPWTRTSMRWPPSGRMRLWPRSAPTRAGPGCWPGQRPTRGASASFTRTPIARGSSPPMWTSSGRPTRSSRPPRIPRAS